MVEQNRLVGLEAELFTLDSSGFISNEADKLLKQLSGAQYVKKECGRNMIELLAPPHHQIGPGFASILENMQQAVEAAEKLDMRLFSFGTYPGRFIPHMRSSGLYGVKKKVFGPRFRIGGRCIGFHCHFDTPSSIPFSKDIRLLGMLDLRQQAGLMNGYNFLISCEPALACLMQSSPFYQGISIGKDSRVIVYRGGRSLHFPLGMYAEHEPFGQLQGYRHSITDMIGMAEQKFDEWSTMVRSIGFNIGLLARYGSVLSTAWNPVKINPHNTLEQRGMDANLPSYMAAASTAIKGILSTIYTQELHVVPSDNCHFSIEGDKLLIPQEQDVREKLQYISAYRGLSDSRFRQYCSKFVSLARRCTVKSERRFLKPFIRSVDEGKTMSDHIIRKAIGKGWRAGTPLENQSAADIALESSELFTKDLRQMLAPAERWLIA